jgi:hypothetical protein
MGRPRRFSRREFLKFSSFTALLGRASLSTPLGLIGGVERPQTGQGPSGPFFVEVPASKTGISWKHANGRSPYYYLPETTGAGCAFLDYDNDGWMDIYLVNSGRCDFYDPNMPLGNALYRNNRDGTFTDVTEKARVAAGGYGMGVAVGDYDGDGFPDLYVKLLHSARLPSNAELALPQQR